MKQWSADHPKAALMARKRAAILDAARAKFLEAGYERTTMESIAKAANVSIMTLYRHARTKDIIFAAVIAARCQPVTAEEEAQRKRLLTLPLPEALLQFALRTQAVLARKDTVSLMRVVIAETVRFPHLAELAYQEFIVRIESVTAFILSQLPETSALSERARHNLARSFVDRIVGAPFLRVLLGLPAPTSSEKRRRAELARNDVMTALQGTQA
jgi:TetR/AcrR family transcriptional repressor of mexJK operon